jgi:iron complex transport system substrate-binding protein
VHESEGDRVIRDLTGRSVVLPDHPRRIAVLALVFDAIATIDPCTSRISGGLKYEILHIGTAPVGLACPRLSDTEVVSARFAPDPERILLHAPDVVVAIGNLASNLDAIGYSGLARIEYRGSRAQMRESIWTFTGAVLGQQDEAASLLRDYHARIEALRFTTPGSGQQQSPRVLEMFGSPGSWRISAGDYYLGDILDVVGGVYAGRGMQHASAVSQEDLFRLDPDVILLQGLGTPGPEVLFNDPSWQAVTAVKARRVYKMPGHNQFNLPVDLALTAAWLAAVLRPESSVNGLSTFASDLFRDVYKKPLDDAKLRMLLETEENARSYAYEATVRGRSR